MITTTIITILLGLRGVYSMACRASVARSQRLMTMRELAVKMVVGVESGPLVLQVS